MKLGKKQTHKGWSRNLYNCKYHLALPAEIHNTRNITNWNGIQTNLTPNSLPVHHIIVWVTEILAMISWEWWMRRTCVICCILWRIWIRVEDVFPMPESMTCTFITLRFNRGEEGSFSAREGKFIEATFPKRLILTSLLSSLFKDNAFWTNLQGICTSHLSSAPSIKDTDTSAVKLNSDLARPHFLLKLIKRTKRHNRGRKKRMGTRSGGIQRKTVLSFFFPVLRHVLLRMRLSP